MHSFAAVIALAATASAQILPAANIAAVSFPSAKSAPLGKGAVGDVVTYDANGVYTSTYNNAFDSASSVIKRGLRARHSDGDCSPQPLGSGPTPSPDTDTAFLADSDFSSAALNAPTPNGWVRTFQNLQASTQQPMGYLGYWPLTSYDTNQCASLCSSTAGCTAFNIYFERDPTLDSGANCTNPPSTTVIKCAYWGAPIEPDTATNNGQYCEDFHIVIAGSNGYVKQQPSYTVPGYNGTFVGNAAIDAPTECNSYITYKVFNDGQPCSIVGNAAIDAPTECNSYITYKVFNDGQPFDPNRCAAACDAETAYNVQYLNSRAICRFFDTYVLLKNNVSQGQICALYTRSWDSSYATNTGYTYNGDVYTIEYSYIWSNSTDPGAQICDATCMSQSPCPVVSSSSSSTTTIAVATSSTTQSISSTITTSSTTTTTTSASTTSSASTISTTKTTTASSLTTSNSSTLKVSSTTSSTTKAATTSSISSTGLISSSTAKTTTPSTIVSSTTKCTTTTAKSTTAAPTTTLKTTTTSSSRVSTMKSTTTSSAGPAATGPCFKVKASGPSWLQNQYLGIDSSSLNKLAYNWGSSTPAVCLIDESGMLTDASDGNWIMRTIENWFNPSYGYMAKNGWMPISAVQNRDSTLTLSTGFITSNIWASQNSQGLMHGSCPSSSWSQVTIYYEATACPAPAQPVQPWGSWWK